MVEYVEPCFASYGNRLPPYMNKSNLSHLNASEDGGMCGTFFCKLLLGDMPLIKTTSFDNDNQCLMMTTNGKSSINDFLMVTD